MPEHSIGPLHPVVVPSDIGYRHLLAVTCRCGWEVRGLNPTAVNNTALDHVTGRREDRRVMGFVTVVDLDG